MSQVTVYQGTAGVIGERIERAGVLRPRPADAHDQPRGISDDWRGVHVTLDRDTANAYAFQWVIHFMHKHGASRRGAIITARAPITSLVPDPEALANNRAFVCEAPYLAVERVEFCNYPRLQLHVLDEPLEEFAGMSFDYNNPNYVGFCCPLGGRDCFKESECVGWNLLAKNDPRVWLREQQATQQVQLRRLISA